MSTTVDFHTHFFSRTFFDALNAASPLAGSPEERLEDVTKSAGITLPKADPLDHWADWSVELDRYGVDHVVTFASCPEEAPVVSKVIEAADGRASGFSVIDPTADNAEARAEQLLGDLGYKGLLLFPAMHGFHPSGEEASRVLAVVDRYEAVATVHCGLLSVGLRDRFGLPREYDIAVANPLNLVPAADRFPNANLVVPHFGGGFFREALMAGTQCGNIYVDTSSSNSWMRTNPGRVTFVEVLERALAVFGADRILFGTDSSVFPRGWRNDLLTLQRESLGAIGGTPEHMRKVFGGNARRLLKLGSGVEASG